MCVHYIEAEIVPNTEQDLCTQVEQALAVHGEPLRWAIVEAGSLGEPVRIEAAVLAS